MIEMQLEPPDEYEDDYNNDEEDFNSDDELNNEIIPEEDLQLNKQLQRKFKKINTPIITQDTNIVISVTVDKNPLDNGAHKLQQSEDLLPINAPTLGRTRVNPSMHSKRHIIVLSVKERMQIPQDEKKMSECISSLRDVIIELNLCTISMRKFEN